MLRDFRVQFVSLDRPARSAQSAPAGFPSCSIAPVDGAVIAGSFFSTQKLFTCDSWFVPFSVAVVMFWVLLGFVQHRFLNQALVLWCFDILTPFWSRGYYFTNRDFSRIGR
jgi:hypothetical protein